ncbi:MAG TPA: PQQ-dependent dehydrogenase, methanol/ethanol family [Bryobacteraceae bacterium]|nr:PQQ-dependent dehydrogenase, methanol/ethanol family [Bryobacteraceae bacterium]
MVSFRNFRLAASLLAVIPFSVAIALSQVEPPVPPPPLAEVLRNYAPVTAERLLNPEDGNWLSIRRTYDGWGYSPLDQITNANVQNLRPVWIFSTSEAKVHEAAPLVNNGVMFVSTPNNQVIAIDVRSGNELWRYHRSRPSAAIVPHDTSRGVALYGNKVYYAAGDAILVALDARTGEEVWATDVAPNKSAYYITLAPLIAGGKIMVGASGGEFGIRGFVAAFDPDSGKELWRTYTIPAPGEPGSETWPKGDAWKTGGGSVWVTGNYDPATNIAYWGVGNGGPWMGDKRPGDNLYTASTLALDVATGAIKGHFQYNPNDSWDWDEVSPPILVDFQREGRTFKGLIDVARDGYIWFLDRGDATTGGRIKYIQGEPYVYQNVFRGIDPETGRPDVDPARRPRTGKQTATYCPELHGGKNWPPVAFSPKTRMVYIPANNNMCSTSAGVEVKYSAGKSFTGVKMEPMSVRAGADHFGEVQAWNVDTGKKVWEHDFATSPDWGSMLATAGGLVFSGGTNDRKMHAFDAETGKLLWEFPTNSGILAPPTSFTVDGKQYIAVLTGWGGDTRGVQANLNRVYPGQYPEVPEGGAVWVFALP